MSNSNNVNKFLRCLIASKLLMSIDTLVVTEYKKNTETTEVYFLVPMETFSVKVVMVSTNTTVSAYVI